MANEGKITKKVDFFQVLVPGSYYPHKNLERIIFSLIYIKNNQNFNNQIRLYSLFQRIVMSGVIF
ncbi:hypothetical protein DKE52_020215 [Acinetobacter pittii]|uniref:Uncharacterized protein n=1 Tax=Acinetobacter pittii TaxID=48296 RepID=A0A3G6YMC1_ACIPI|nr:hypothetical protein DKE52_020215 [Acinetobacter pittii]